MKIIRSIFLIFWASVYIMLVVAFFKQNMSYVKKIEVVDYHVVGVTMPMLLEIEDKHQMAAILGHEMAHIVLGHTTSSKHSIVDEYAADLVSVYIVEKAGYNMCSISKLWDRIEKQYLLLRAESHPSSAARAKYMKLPQCVGVINKQERVTFKDVEKIFEDLKRNLPVRFRYRIKFRVFFFYTEPNAFAYTVMREVK
jgi:hypothetical protein